MPRALLFQEWVVCSATACSGWGTHLHVLLPLRPTGPFERAQRGRLRPHLDQAAVWQQHRRGATSARDLLCDIGGGGRLRWGRVRANDDDLDHDRHDHDHVCNDSIHD